jgi:putative MATE family efflux protein
MKKNRVKEFIRDPKKALFKLASPILVAMVVQTMYNIVDTAFVGRLGAEAIAAVTFSFPLFFILIAMNSGIGAGMSSRIARFLGEKKKGGAENAAMHGLVISLTSSALIYFIGMPLLKPLFLVFGASGNVLSLAMDYMRIILVGAFFMLPAYTLTNILAAQGDTKTTMKIQVIALVLNAILDPILIFGMGLGVKGAALATAISFTIALLLGIYYIKKASYLHIRRKAFNFSWFILKEIIRIGMPASLMMLIMSVYIIFLNKIMIHFGVEYVAAFGIVSRLESVAVMPVVAISLSTMTLVGMFFGAKRYDLVRNIAWFSARMGALIASSVGVVFFIFPRMFLRIFTPSAELLNIGAPYLRLDVFTFPLMAFSIIISRIMQGMGFGLPGLVINTVRIFFVAIPLAYVMVFVFGFGYLSVAGAMILGGIAANIIAFSWLEAKFRKYDHQKQNI